MGLGFQPVLTVAATRPDRQDAYATLLSERFEFRSCGEVAEFDAKP